MTNNFNIITSNVIKKILDSNSDMLLNIIKQAYVQYANGSAINPPSSFLKYPDIEKARIIALPSLIKENPRIAGIKWISSNPENLKIGLRRASAVIILNDYDTGYPIACLEGGIISAIRTVYSALLVNNLIKRNLDTSIGIIGAGFISENFISSYLSLNKVINKINLFDIDHTAQIKFKQNISHLISEDKIEIMDSIKKTIKESEIIFFATSSTVPYVSEYSWFDHNPLVLNISLRDLSPEIILNSNNIVDDIEHVLNANTSPHLAQLMCGNHEFINCSISKLIAGYNNFDSSKPIVFSPMGMGVLDLAVADYVYTEAIKQELYLEIKNFF